MCLSPVPWRHFPQWTVVMLLTLGFSASEIQAQPIVPSLDGTGTIVTPENDRFDISGGSLSETGQNLFHSFEQFGLNPGQVANFLANPNIQNILSRVIGGDASVIDGLLEVTGGTPNLYLMNPAGIIFGNGARLNVPASFTATTATGIEFDQGIFNAFQDNDYQLLIGDPSSLIFAIVQPGAIVNAGVLAVPDLANLTLAAGQVLNLGTLSGQGVTVTTLPGRSVVRLTPNGRILSLDLSLQDNISIENFSPSKLPDLLLKTDLEQATTLDIQADGSVWLVSSENSETSESIVGSQVEILSTGIINGNGLISSDRLSLTAQRIGVENNPLLLRVNELITHTTSIDGNSGNQALVNLKDLNSLNLNAGNTGLITLSVAGKILDSDTELDVQSGGLKLEANTGIGTIASPLQTAVSTLAAQVSEPGGFALENTGDLTVQTVDQLSGIHTQSGTIALEAKGGRLTLNSEISNQPAIQAGEAGDLSLKANEIILNVNPQSGGAQTYQGSLILGTDVQLNSPQQQNIIFNGTIDSAPNATPHSLTVTTGGLTQFNGAIGSLSPLSSLETDGQGIEGEQTVLNTNQIKTIGSQYFNDPVQISQSIQLTGSDIQFARSLESQPEQNIDFSINTNRFLAQDNMGEQNPFSTVIINAKNNLEINGNLFTLNGVNLTSQNGFIQTQNIQTTGGNITLETLGLNTPISNQPRTQPGDIQVGAIQTRGGSVNINSKRFFRSTNTINRSSISTVGSQNGAITIVHAGQFLNRPFIVGNYSLSNNGVAGNLRTNIATLPATQAFPGSVIGGNIQILAGRDNPPVNIEFIPPQISSSLTGSVSSTETSLETIEDVNTLEFQNAFGRDPVRQATPEEVQKLLRSINNNHQQTEDQEKFAAIYLYYDRINDQAEGTKDTIFNRGRVLRPDDPPLTEDSLSLLIVTEEEIKQIQIPETINRSRVSQSIQLLRDRLMDPENNRGYKPFAAQLYDWIAKPITEALQDTSVNNLMFVLGRGLRSLPLAALYNRKTDQFFIEEYGLALVPSISYLDDTAVSLNQTQTLAMGASAFANNDNVPLPAVPLELELVRETRPTQVLQDEQFTFENLQNILRQNQEAFSKQPLIMHLATHADFGEVVVPDVVNLRSNRANSILNSSNQFSDRQIKDISYLQFFDRKLRLDELEKLELDKAGDVELFVISACNTATGNDNAELGFAGLSIQMGAQSALASLWQVSDIGTMVLMGEFYNQLNHNYSRTQALRQAQLAMLRGEIGNIEYNQLNLSNRSVAISPDLAQQILANPSDSKQLDLRHPFYWSAFTLIGSPW